jgi:protein phosphatase
MQYYALSEKGTHATNEDNYCIERLQNKFLFAVADGLGGLPKADLASTLGITELKDYLLLNKCRELQMGIQKANQAVFIEGERLNTHMATTLAAAVIDTDTGECTISHVGDSRVYLFSETTWKTKDHTLVQELVELGIITEQGAFTHPEKHRLNRALGTASHVDVDTYETLLDSDTILVISSDGMHNFIDDDEIKHIVTTHTPKSACEHLTKKARKNKSTDDITVIVIQY